MQCVKCKSERQNIPVSLPTYLKFVEMYHNRMDCIKPANPLYITVKDIKRSGQSTIFIEYFVHVQKHMQNEQRYQQEIKHIQRARALERVRHANDFTVRRITDVPPPEDEKRYLANPDTIFFLVFCFFLLSETRFFIYLLSRSPRCNSKRMGSVRR